MQDMLRRSPSPVGDLHLGITVTNSFFQILGQTLVYGIVYAGERNCQERSKFVH